MALWTLVFRMREDLSVNLPRDTPPSQKENTHYALTSREVCYGCIALLAGKSSCLLIALVIAVV